MQSKISILTIHLVIRDATERLDFVVERYSSAELLIRSAGIQVLQGHLIAELVLILEEKVRMSAISKLCFCQSNYSRRRFLIARHKTDNALN